MYVCICVYKIYIVIFPGFISFFLFLHPILLTICGKNFWQLGEKLTTVFITH